MSQLTRIQRTETVNSTNIKKTNSSILNNVPHQFLILPSFSVPVFQVLLAHFGEVQNDGTHSILCSLHLYQKCDVQWHPPAYVKWYFNKSQLSMQLSPGTTCLKFKTCIPQRNKRPIHLILSKTTPKTPSCFIDISRLVFGCPLIHDNDGYTWQGTLFPHVNYNKHLIEFHFQG